MDSQAMYKDVQKHAAAGLCMCQITLRMTQMHTAVGNPCLGQSSSMFRNSDDGAQSCCAAQGSKASATNLAASKSPPPLHSFLLHLPTLQCWAT